MHIFSLLSCLLIGVVAGYLDDLQIGITKSVPNCQERAFPGDVLAVHYTGIFRETEEEFDSSYPRGQPISFTLGSGQVIYGWDQGLIGTCVGEERRLQIPSNFAYGETGVPGVIPPDTDMIFDVKLVSINK